MCDTTELEEADENATDSVYYLITQLCRNMASKYDLEEPECSAAVRELRSSAFEILLKKSTQPHVYPEEDNTSGFDAQRAIDMHIFSAKLHTRAAPEACERYAALEQQMGAIKDLPYFVNGAGRDVLQLLLLLQRDLSEQQQAVVPSRPSLLVPGPFTLFASYENNPYYPKPQTCDWLEPKPRFFKGIHELQAMENPYIDKDMPGGGAEACNMLAKIEQKYGPKTAMQPPASAQDCTFTAMTRRLLGASVRVNMQSYRLLQNFSVVEPQTFAAKGSPFKVKFQQQSKAQNAEHPKLPTKAEPAKSTAQPQRILSWNWQSLGCRGVPRQRPFASEASEVFIDLKCHLSQQQQKQPFMALIMSSADFMHDLKALTAGIQSDTFQHDDAMIFSMREHVTIQGLLPETVASYAESFLECGTCYKRLQTMIQKRDYKLMFDGFIFRALCAALDEYLLTFRQFVFAQRDDSLIAYYARMRNIMRQISNLSFTLAIHTDVDAHVTIPMGSQFLGYLYREILDTTENDYIMLLMYILKSCCHVYFKHLQKWIYYGLLDDPCNELFICFVDHYRPNTKYFYDKAYFVRKDAVPGFFQGYEDDILQCGKYTMLLKAYKPNHPLFTLDYPLITVCLTYDEIQRLKKKCIRYRERVRAACGATEVSIRQIFEERAAKKRLFYQRACQRTNENLKKWSLEQNELALLAAEQKQRRWNEMTAALQDAKQRKIDERRANVELELRVLREAERVEEQQLLRENINLRKRIEYYQELSEQIRADAAEKLTKQRQRAEQWTATATAEVDAQQQSKLSPQLSEGNSSSVGGALAPPAPHTPNSGGTDFESCCGEVEEAAKEEIDVDVDADADADSGELYADCLREEFVDKFADTENALHALCADKAAAFKGSSAVAESAHKTLVMLTEQPPAAGANLTNATALRLGMKRSASDVLNSNELPLLSHALGAATKTALAAGISSTTFGPAPPLVIVNGETGSENEKPLTEAQRNKLRVMAHEYGDFSSSNTAQPQADINLNTLPDSELTDLQRNRRHMMQNDLFAEYNKLPADRAQLNLNLSGGDTERARNRRRVLESEYDILTGLSSVEVLTAAVAAATPMSTTSDTPLTEHAPPAPAPGAVAAALRRSDIANANVMPPSPAKAAAAAALKINVELANGQACNVMDGGADTGSAFGLLTCPTAGTLEHAITPECALNTAGLQAKRGGFDFADVAKQQKKSLAATEVPIQPANAHDDDSADDDDYDDEAKRKATTAEEMLIPQQDYTTTTAADPYSRSKELLATNFTCATRSPYIRLNMPNAPNTPPAATAKLRPSFRQLKVNSMSVITLTEFLQKSVILPMTTYLGLVNNEVMRLFLDELHVLDHLRSLRHFYFLMDGEFGSIICDGLIGKLEGGATPAKLLNYQILHSILDTALSSSITGNDKNAENLSFTITDVPHKFDLSQPGVLNVLSLSYRIEWPLNLILNPETLEQYGKIFKYLIKVHRISWVLERAYQLLKEAVQKCGKSILHAPQYRHVQMMRHKFYHFVHALQNHITANALQASWKTFKDDLLQAKSIEDIYRKHTTYVKRILFLCMLNRHSAEFYNMIENIFKISLRFYNNLKSREFKLRPGDEHFTHSRYEKLTNDEQEFDTCIKFTIYLGNKIVRHGYQEEIGQLIELINFNQYYSATSTSP